jgi:HEPN domain-containing protein
MLGGRGLTVLDVHGDLAAAVLALTEVEIIAHWRKGAADALEMATLAFGAAKYDHALFNCQLAVEKDLKAAIIDRTGNPNPRIYNLRQLAALVGHTWTPKEQQMFDALSAFAVAARHDDPPWAEQYASRHNASHWIDVVTSFLSKHLL